MRSTHKVGIAFFVLLVICTTSAWVDAQDVPNFTVPSYRVEHPRTDEAGKEIEANKIPKIPLPEITLSHVERGQDIGQYLIFFPKSQERKSNWIVVLLKGRTVIDQNVTIEKWSPKRITVQLSPLNAERVWNFKFPNRYKLAVADRQTLRTVSQNMPLPIPPPVRTDIGTVSDCAAWKRRLGAFSILEGVGERIRSGETLVLDEEEWQNNPGYWWRAQVDPGNCDNDGDGSDVMQGGGIVAVFSGSDHCFNEERRIYESFVEGLSGERRERYYWFRVPRRLKGFCGGGNDCDDNDANRFPGNIEIPNNQDEDCDPTTIGERDLDGDGYTDSRVDNSEHYPDSEVGTDCDDSNSSIHPHASEVCDGKDNDCDADYDEEVLISVFRDADLDLYGDPLTTQFQCHADNEWVVNSLDCDDSNRQKNPMFGWYLQSDGAGCTQTPPN